MAALSSPDEDDGSMTRHRADALEPPQAGDMAVNSTHLSVPARPLPTPPVGQHSGPTATPSRPPPPPHPSQSIPHPGLTASSSGRSRVAPRRSHECTHPILVRMYSRHHTCECCSRLPPEGYVFRCAHDRELILADLIRHNEHFPFDQLGRQLAGLVGPIKRGAELRAAGATRDSVLEEMTAAEAASYTEAQIEELAAQRKHALRTAKEDTFRALFPRSTAVLRARIEAVVDAALGEAPWVPQEEDECQLMVCRQCRPYYSERCFLSLGGIANGDVPPTAALGFGFHVHDRRPIVDAAIARRLGLRGVSKAHTTQEQRDIDHCRGLSAPPPFDLMELIQAHLGGADDLQQPMNKTKSPTPSLDGSGKTQPRSVVKASNSGTENTPASPSCIHLFRCAAAGSPNSTPPHLSDNGDELACVPTQLCHSGRLLPSNQESFDRACRTPLPRPDQKELVVLVVDPKDLPAAVAAADSGVVDPVGPPPWPGHEFMPKTPMEQQVDVDGVFGPGPLSVPGGLAVTEEGIEMGIADVATTNVG
ncbi:hypothetical protein MAPG_08125 [Magnaporthiopsis poae ATCC 64411]|uniref:Uncharacterized protein n=1 Tax=Magnaporthiopsis poae (strain ATCC 64411 / 73-15) TaxID=644358 RepID=A0A0C4E6I7_MAGP6|nr:hypothetical protein MAPG_08125 [Magnaporthiopsis poae ATCC 64411]